MMGTAVSRRISDQAAKHSMTLTSPPSTPTARRVTIRTTNTVRWPATVARVSAAQRRRTSASQLARKRTASSPHTNVRRRRMRRMNHMLTAAPRSPIRSATRSLASRPTNPPSSTANTTAPITPAMRSWVGTSPVRARRPTATTGKATRTSWFQMPVTSTARLARSEPNPQPRSMANWVPMPTTSPPGRTIEAAVDVWVTTIARR